MSQLTRFSVAAPSHLSRWEASQATSSCSGQVRRLVARGQGATSVGECVTILSREEWPGRASKLAADEKTA
jgi:hypothetical protein